MKSLKNSLKYILTFSSVCLSIFSFGQSQQVKGFVVDAANQNPMPFVNIAVIGSSYGTVSNQNGEFTINLDAAKDDSVAFQHIGYKTFIIGSSRLEEGIIIELEEQKINIREVTILANPVTAQELINNALYRTGVNYPEVPQRMEIFKRRNSASYIDKFDVSLIKSDIDNIDTSFIKILNDSIPRYTRSYSDNLYALFTWPNDSAKALQKVEGIKKVVLEEDDGGELEQIEEILVASMNKKEDENTFWKIKTGILSMKVDEGESDAASDTSVVNNLNMDSLWLRNPPDMYRLMKNEYSNWSWDFIRKPEQYKYVIEGIIPVEDEFAYVISFAGRLRGDYQGRLYISYSTYAILRIEYSIKNRRKAGGFRILGIAYSELDDSGLIIYTKDERGYFLKYAMSSNANEYGINRVFSVIKKRKRAIIGKKVNEVELDLKINGHDITVNETLVVSREVIDKELYSKIIDKGVKPEKINAYSDSLWDGYSVIEPTKQMKEYRSKLK